MSIGCGNCVFISVVRDFPLYERLVRRNPVNAGGRFVALDNRTENLSITSRYNSVLDGWDYGTETWFVFLHEDFQFLEPVGDVLAHADAGRIYGVVGPSSTRPGSDVLFSLNSERDGGRLGFYGKPFKKPVAVLTTDCNCLIVHSSLVQRYRLRFDEKLLFDLYAEDFEINAREKFGVGTFVIPVRCRHWSFGHMGDRFFRQRRYLLEKYASASRVYRTTTRQLIGPLRMVVRAVCDNRRWIRRDWLRRIGHFFWYVKFSRDGYMRIRVFGMRLKFRYASAEEWMNAVSSSQIGGECGIIRGDGDDS